MPKFEFGHLYKFVASLGVALIAAAAIVPWLFTQSLQVLSISQASLKGLTPVARRTLEQRRYWIAWTQQNFIGWLGLGLLLIGIALLIWGIIYWKQRQVVLDSNEDVDLSTKRAAFESATPQEIEAKQEGEVSAEVEPSAEADQPPEPKATGKSSGAIAETRQYRLQRLRGIEATITEKAITAFSPTFDVNSNVRLKEPDGTGPVLDLLLDPTDDSRWAQLAIDVQVASMAKTLPLRLFNSMLSLAIATRKLRDGVVYTGKQGRPVHASTNAVLLIVLDDESDIDRVLARVSTQVRLANSVLRRPVGVLLTEARTLEQISSEALRDKIAEAWARAEEAIWV